MRFVVGGALVLAGCYAPSVTAGGPCSDAGNCPAGLQCIAGACLAEPPPDDAALDDMPVDVAIDACADLTCTGTMLTACGVSTTCDFGCLATGVPHCARITPSNGLSWDLVPSSAGALVLSGDVTLDTSAGTLSQGGTPLSLPPGVAITTSGGMRVLALGELAFQATATLSVVGNVPLAILVTGDATLPTGARISLAAGGCPGSAFDPTCGGPGGGTGGALTAATGCGPGQYGGQNVIGGTYEVGGGGGGHGFDGAFSNDTAVGRGRNGNACGASTLEPLTGGSGGGGGGIDLTAMTRIGGRGGGGGGAVQITVAGTFTLAGVIDAAGAGGENGRWMGSVNTGGGGGGGAGGGILVEAGVMTGTGGRLTANGGGGGGNVAAPATGQLVHGETGRPDQSCAQGGGSDGDAAPGGRGGCRSSSPNNGNGGAGLNGAGDRGGGGGAGGRIRINARTSTLANLTTSPNDTRGTPPLE